MTWKTIVVGYDESDSAARALQRATELAKSTRGRILVTSVAPLLVGMAASRGIGPFDPADPPDEHRHMLAKAREALAGEGVAAEFELGFGEPADAIVHLADEHDADLIVVGTREPGFLERLLGGSVSQGVSRHAHCDVLIVH